MSEGEESASLATSTRLVAEARMKSLVQESTWEL